MSTFVRMTFGMPRSFVKKAQLLFGLICVLLTMAQPTKAASNINNQISYQARLMDPSGFPVADGTYSIKFSIYDSPSGGTRLWTANGTIASPSSINVDVENGLFTILLGDTGQNSLDTVDWNQDSLYLGITIGTDGEMSPRRRLGAAAQAFNARQLQGMYASSTAFGTASLFAINQTSNTAATGTRTALEVRSAGTSDANDFLIRGINDLSNAVFTVNRAGNVTSSGVIASNTVTTSQLFVAGSLVCLSNGTNCTASSGTSSLQQVTNIGATTSNMLTLLGGFVSGSSTVTSSLSVISSVTSSALGVTVPVPVTSFDYSTGYSLTTTSTPRGLSVVRLNAGGDDYSAISFSDNVRNILAVSSTVALYDHDTNSYSINLYGAGGVSNQKAEFDLNDTDVGAAFAAQIKNAGHTSSSAILALQNNTANANVGLYVGTGSPEGSIFSNAGSIYFNATNTTPGSQVFLKTTSQSVNGWVGIATTDMLTGGSTSSLQQVTNVGATTSNMLTLYGGFLAGSSTVTSTFTVLGNTSLQAATATTFGVTTASATQLFVAGQLVCLANGANCVYAASTSTLQQVTNNGATTTNEVYLLGGLIAPSSTVTSTFTSIGSANFYPSTSTNPVAIRTAGIAADGQFVPGLSVTSTNENSGIQIGTYGVLGGNAPALYFSDNLNTLAPFTSATSASIFFSTSTSGLYSYYQNPLGGGSEFAIQDLNASNTQAQAAAQIINFGNNSSTAILRLRFANSSEGGSIVQHVGDGSPEGSVYANNGSIYFNINPVSGSTAYLKTQNGNSTGWKAIATTDMISSSDLNWLYNNSSDSVRNATATTDILLGSAATSTGAPAYFDLSGGTNGTSTFYFGHATNTNVIIGGTSTTVGFMSPQFSINGNDLFVGGNIGSVSSVFTNGAFVAGTGTTMFGDGFITKTNGRLTLSASQGIVASDRLDANYLNRWFTSPLLNNSAYGAARATTTVGTNPAGIAFDGAYIWVANSGSNNVSKIDVTTNAVVATTTVGSSPQGMAFDGSYVWVANLSSNSVSKINVTTNAVVATTTVGSSPFDVAFDGRYLWVVNNGSNNVSKIDTTTNAVVATTTVGSSPQSIAFDGNFMWVTNNSSNNVSKINVSTNAVVATTTVGTNPTLLAFDGGHVWVANSGSNNVSKIDINTNAVVATTTVGSFPAGVAFDGKDIWVANFSSNNVSKIDINTNAVVATTPVGSGPAVLTFDGSHIWAANYLSNNVSKLPIGGGNGTSMQLNLNLVSSGNIYASGTATIANGLTQIWSSSSNPSNLSSSPLTTSAKPGDIIGNYEYVSDGTKLNIFDISDPNHVKLVTQLATGESLTSSIAHDGHTLYVRGSSHTFIIDVSAPHDPFIVAQPLNPSGTTGIWRVQNGYLYTERCFGFCPSGGDLVVYKLGPTSLTEVGSVTDAVDGDLVVSGKYVYAIDNAIESMNTIYVGDPTAPSISGSADLSALSPFLSHIAVAGRYAYLTDSFNNYLITVDISDDEFPTGVKFLSGFTSPSYVAVAGRYAYVTDNASPSVVRVVDVQTTSSQSIVKSIQSGTDSMLNFLPVGRYGFAVQVGSSNDGLYAYDLQGSEIANLTAHELSAGDVNVQGRANFADAVQIQTSLGVGDYLTVGGQQVCLADGTNCQTASSSVYMTVVAATSDVSNPFDAAVSGTYMYVSDDGNRELEIFDVSDTSNPTLIGNVSLTYSGSVRGIYVKDGFAYVAIGATSNTLDIVNVSNPASPTLVGVQGFGSGNDPSDVYVKNGYAYVTNGTNHLSVVNVSTPSAPVLVATSTVGTNPTGVTVNGNYAYTANFGSDNVSVVDISNPASPSVVATVGGLAQPQYLDSANGFVYVANTQFGNDTMGIIDARSPANATLVTSTYAGVGPLGIAVAGHYAYLTDTHSGGHTVSTVDIQDPYHPRYVSLSDVTYAGNSIVVSGNYAYMADSGFQQRVSIAEITGDDTTDLYAVNGLLNRLDVKEALTVAGQSVCLANGTNCPSGSASNLQSVTNIGATTSNMLSLYAGYLAGSSTVTSTFTVLGGTNLQSATATYVTATQMALNYALSVGDPSTNTVVITADEINHYSAGGAFVLRSNNGEDFTIETANTGLAQGQISLDPGSISYGGNLILGDFFGATTDTLMVEAGNAIFGNFTTTTGAAAYYDLYGHSGGPSNVYFGYNTNTNVLIGGTSTTNTGLNGLFALNGDDLFVHGNIGSVSSVYTNGEFVAGAGSTHYGDGYIDSLAGPLTIYSNSATGTSLINSLDNRLTTQSAFRTASTTYLNGTFPIDVVVQGHYAYTVNETDSSISVVDITNPSAPSFLTNFTSGSVGGGDPRGLFVSGHYLYVANEANGTLSIFDISRPKAPVVTGELLSLTSPWGVYVQGDRAYVISNSGLLYIVDVSNPASPVLKNTVSVSSGATNVVVQGRYAYVANTNFSFSVIDLASSTPSVVGTGTTHGNNGKAIRVEGNYLVTGSAGSSTVDVFDISTPSSPSRIGTVTLGNNIKGNGNSLFMSGRYVYAINNSGVNVIDIGNPSNPTTLLTYAVGSNPNGVFVSGKDAYTLDSSTNLLYVVDVTGIETNGLLAHSADLGSLQVQSNATIFNDASIGGSLTVGSGGIFSQGLFSSSVSSTSSSASFINSSAGTDGTEWGAYINKLLVGSNTNATGTSNFQAVFTYASGTTSMGVCIDDTATAAKCPSTGFGGASLLTDGVVASNAFDLAETYSLSGSAVPGDVLVMDGSASGTVKQSDGTAYDAKLIGVVSTEPGFLLGWNTGSRVALAGHVPAHVSLENGDIHVGDPLTSSHTPGYAMKATKAGRIIGYALDDATATGTIDIFVHAGWNAGGVIGTDGSLTTINDNVLMGASETVSSTHVAADSWGLTFRGQAWDASSSAAVNRDFTLLTDVISATSSAFTIRNASGTPLFTLDQDGSASVNGDLQVGGKLYLSSRGSKQNDYYVFLDSNVSGTYIGTNADGFQSLDTYDFAERFLSPDALEAGDLVVVKDAGGQHVQRSMNEDEMLVGIVSTRPAFVAGRPATDTYPIALTGRVPTKVSTIKGNIKAGDALAPSTIPGVAVKATKTGPIVGLALEDYTGDQIGKINVYVNPGWWTAPSEDAVINQTIINQTVAPTSTDMGSTRRGLAKIEAGSTQVHVSFSTINAYPFVQVTPRGLITGGWGTDHYTDNGFDIILGQPQSFDAYFSWQVEALDNGDRLYQSDGTYLDLNQMTGMPIGTEPPTSTATSTESEPSPSSGGGDTTTSEATATTSSTIETGGGSDAASTTDSLPPASDDATTNTVDLTVSDVSNSSTTSTN